MSAFGTKRTSQNAELMSAFGGKADIRQIGRDVRNDPKRTSAVEPAGDEIRRELSGNTDINAPVTKQTLKGLDDPTWFPMTLILGVGGNGN